MKNIWVETQWTGGIKQVHSKASSRLYLFRQIRNFLDTKQSKIVFTSLVQSIMDYAGTIWSSCSSKSQNSLQKIQNRCLRCIFIIYPILVPNLIILEIYFTRLDGLIWTRRQSHMCILTYKTATGDAPPYHRMRLNMRNSLDVTKTLNRTGDLAFSVAAPRL